MRKPVAAIVLALLASAACRERAASRVPDTAAAASSLASRGNATTNIVPAAEVIAAGLEVPWDLAFAPDGRIFLTERAGRVRVIENGTLRPEPWATVPTTARGEAGLMGIALAPDFATTPHVYVVGTFEAGGELVNRVIRFTERDARASDQRVLIDGIPAAQFHAGDAIDFGPDGMLYVATGDARQPDIAQDPASLGGKILRYTPDGGIPADNPSAGSPVYAMGLRNPQGLAWDPESGAIFAIDHGPSGFPNERFRRNDDELNAIRAGANYGWPQVAGASRSDRFVPPIVVWDPAIAPAGLARYTGEQFPEWRGDLFVGALRGTQLRRVSLERASDAPAGWRATGQQALFEGEYGRIRAVAMAPDGQLYFTTSNRDGRGSPSAQDDRVLRLVRR